MPASSELILLARAAATKHALDPALVCAIIEQESSWNPHAIRYEPGFRTRYVAPLGLPPTEEIARSISWGLMQVMGQVAREHGFEGKFLSALCDPAIGLDIGCAALAAKVSAAARAFTTRESDAPAEGHVFSPAAQAALPGRQPVELGRRIGASAPPVEARAFRPAKDVPSLSGL